MRLWLAVLGGDKVLLGCRLLLVGFSFATFDFFAGEGRPGDEPGGGAWSSDARSEPGPAAPSTELVSSTCIPLIVSDGVEAIA